MINLPENIQKDLDLISSVADDLMMKPFIVGGLPRDLMFGYQIDDDTDLDITEKYGNAFDLAFFVSAKYNLMQPQIYPSSGTALVMMESGRAIEFHNAFYNVPHIIDQLYAMGIKPTPINKDVYSRDFTIDTLLYDFVDGTIIDITKMGIPDIQNRILRVPIKAEKTLARSPKNILRGIRFKIQFNLTEDEDYTKAVQKYIPDLIRFMLDNPDSQMIARTVKKTFRLDHKRAYEEYSKLGLWEYIPDTVIDKNAVMKSEIFGIDVMPKVAQTKMMKRLLDKHDKHRDYMRRKRREESQKMQEMRKIFDRARSGYYLTNDEPEFVKQRKIDKRQKLYDYISKKDY